MFRRLTSTLSVRIAATATLLATSIPLANCSSPKISHEEDERLAAKYRPSLEEYERVDENVFDPKYDKYRSQHIIYSALLGESRVERYEIYKSKKTEEIYCLLKLGDKVNGWPNIVHGGLSALLIDNTYGWLFTAFQLPPAVTANLNVNYRSPIFPKSYCILQAKIDGVDGKKLHMSASIKDAETDKLQVESTTLFIFIKKQQIQSDTTLPKL